MIHKEEAGADTIQLGITAPERPAALEHTLIDVTVEAERIRPIVFEGFNKMTFGTSRRNPFANDTRESLEILSGNMSPEFGLLHRTYVALGTRALRIDWLKEQRALAYQRQALLLAATGLKAVDVVDPASSDITIACEPGHGLMTHSDDYPTLNFAFSNGTVGQLHTDYHQVLEGKVYHAVKRLEKKIKTDDARIFIGPTAYRSWGVNDTLIHIATQLRDSGVKIDEQIFKDLHEGVVKAEPYGNLEVAVEDTARDSRYFSDYTAERRWGANTQVIGLTADDEFTLAS